MSFRLLLVGPVEDDSEQGKSFFDQFSWPVERARDCQEASALLHDGLTRVVVCERTLPDGYWTAILEMATSRRDPPVLIVTFRLADERLWSEVLNLGGYDVLAKPFDRNEVERTVNLAWQHWASRRELTMRTKRASQESEDYLCSRA